MEGLDNFIKRDTILAERDRVWKEYCTKMGWPLDPEKLTFEQIIEIRKLPEWINAGQNPQP